MECSGFFHTLTGMMRNHTTFVVSSLRLKPMIMPFLKACGLSSIIFSKQWSTTAWFCSHSPFCHGLSAAVFNIKTFKFPHISVNSGFANSPPLSARNFLGAPIPEPTHVCIIQFITVSGCLSCMMQAKVNRLNMSIIYNIYKLPFQCFKSIATASLNSDARSWRGLFKFFTYFTRFVNLIGCCIVFIVPYLCILH